MHKIINSNVSIIMCSFKYLCSKWGLSHRGVTPGLGRSLHMAGATTFIHKTLNAHFFLIN